MSEVAPKSEATKLYKKDVQKLKRVVSTISAVLAIVTLITYCATPVFRGSGNSSGIASSPAREERRAAEAAQEAAQAEQVALARARVNEELLRFDEGRWFLQGHTQENEWNEWEVFIDSFSVNSAGKVNEFVFTYSFILNSKAYVNTWSCEVSQMQRYDCTVRQQYDGGSWRSEGRLIREDESSFNGRFLYEHEWHLISLVRKDG